MSVQSPVQRRSHPLNVFEPLFDHPDFPGIRDPAYFATRLPSFRSPLELPDLEKGVAILQSVIEHSGSIVIAGDRDVDGVAATALFGTFLRDHHQGEVDLRVSDDGDDYGLTGSFFENIEQKRADLVILLDMGSSHAGAIEHLVRTGAKVIVLDHHQIPEPLFESDSLAFINPVRNNSERIATVGLVFKFLLAFALSRTGEWSRVYSVVAPSGEGHLYRCGLYLGVTGDREIPDDSVTLLPADSPLLSRVVHTEILEDPEHKGGLLLAERIHAMPRLCRFLLDLSDLVAIGTMTDMMPLSGENRLFVKMGSGALSCGTSNRPRYRPGVRALLRAQSIRMLPLLSRDLAWSIGPVLNAAGRMGETRLALELLMADSDESAKELAKRLMKLNRERRARTTNNEQRIRDYLSTHPEKLDRPFLFCYLPTLEPGVSGIVATRLVERYHRPVLYLNPDGSQARGSARTCSGINILDLLSHASDLFTQYGGHPEACGFSIAYDKIDELERRLSELYPRIESELKRPAPGDPHHITLPVSELNWKALEELKWLEPFGQRNPEVLIRVEDLSIDELRFMSEGKHAVFTVQGRGRTLEFVAWNRGEEFQKLHDAKTRFGAIGSLERNLFGNRNILRFRIERVV